ncbi:CYTH domain-containing protein [Klebsiella pneumoniae]|nr:CYTH domain-containing protein [Klebsiella pneumoniae]
MVAQDSRRVARAAQCARGVGVIAGQLLNIYYETADNWLRRHDMGPRIRGDQGRYEMTLENRRSGGRRPAPAPGI